MNLDVVYSIIDKKVVTLEEIELLKSCKNVLKVNVAMIRPEYDIFNVIVLNDIGYEDHYLVYLPS